MLSSYLVNNTNFLDDISSWEDSIRVAAQPLLDKGNITSQYIEDMINNVNTNGSYVVIVPGIAMPHARNEGGVLKTGVSFLKLKNPVLFPDEKAVQILFVLAAEDNEGHLDLISDLSSMLIDEDIMRKVKEVESEDEIIELIQFAEEQDI
jgi:PTS system mannitol-specific IIA component/PTS system ascorbate-specific IIA component